MTVVDSPQRFYIPNCLEYWPWPRHINPHYQEVKKASAAWAESFGAFNPKAQHAYNACDFSEFTVNSYIEDFEWATHHSLL